MILGSAMQQAAAAPVWSAFAMPAQIEGVAPRWLERDRAAPRTSDRDFLGMFGRGSGPGLSVPVSAQMSFGFRYEYLTEEDLVFEVAETGSMAQDYDSHRVMIRAKWRF